MTAFSEPSHFFGFALCFGVVGDIALQVLPTYINSEEDVRSSALNAIYLLSEATFVQLQLLGNWLNHPSDNQIILGEMVVLPDKSQKAFVRIGRSLEQSIKLSQIAIFDFQIEHLFTSLLEAIENQTERGKEPSFDKKKVPTFYTKVKSIAKFFPTDSIFKDAAMTFEDAAMVHRKIRNTGHSNGVHHKIKDDEKLNYVVHGIAFNFIDRELVDCASWGKVAFLQKTILELLPVVLNHPDIKKIEFIPDKFMQSLPDPV